MPKKKDFTIAKAFVKSVDEENGVLSAAVASVGVTDRAGDIIEQDGWRLQNFKKNPQLLWGHNQLDYRPPIGRVEKIWFEGKGKDRKMMFQPKFDLKDKFAKEIFRKYKEGYLNAFSVGFQALEREENVFKDQELLEISAVAVPANPEALVVQRAFEKSNIKPVGWEEVYTQEKKTKKKKKKVKKAKKRKKVKKVKQPKKVELTRDEKLVMALKKVDKAITMALEKINNKEGGE